MHNRLHDVKARERVNVPELPCDFKDPRSSAAAHQKCIDNALAAYRASGVITAEFATRLRQSALRARAEARKTPLFEDSDIAQAKP